MKHSKLFTALLITSAVAAFAAPVAMPQTPATASEKGCNSTIAFVDFNRIIRDSVPGQTILAKLDERAKKIDKDLTDLQAQLKSEDEAEPLAQQEIQQKMMALYQSKQELYQAAQQFIPALFNDILSSQVYTQEQLRKEGLSAVIHKEIAIIVDSRCEVTEAVMEMVNTLYKDHPDLFNTPFDMVENAQAPGKAS